MTISNWSPEEKRTLRNLSIFVVAVMFIALQVFSIINENQQHSSDIAVESATVSTQPQITIHKIDDEISFSFDDGTKVKFTISSPQRFDSFVVVLATIELLDKQSTAIDLSNLKVVDSENRVFDGSKPDSENNLAVLAIEYEDLLAGSDLYPLGDSIKLQPNIPICGWLYFDIAANSKNLKLMIGDNDYVSLPDTNYMSDVPSLENTTSPNELIY